MGDSYGLPRILIGLTVGSVVIVVAVKDVTVLVKVNTTSYQKTLVVIKSITI